MKIYKHIFEIRVLASKMNAGKFLGTINDTLKEFGVDQKIDAEMSIAEVNITGKKKLTQKEIEKAEIELEKVLKEAVPAISDVVFKEVVEEVRI